jgi:hypothetical protein
MGLITVSGIALGITVLCRPIFLAYLPFAVLFVLFRYGENWPRRIAYALVMASMAFLAIMPWTLRNYAKYDRLLLVSTGSGLFLWRGNNELTRGDTNDRYLNPGAGEIWVSRLKGLEPMQKIELANKYELVKRDLQELDGIDGDRYLQKLAISFMVEHPGHALALFTKKLRTLYTPFTEVRSQHRSIFNDTQRLTFSLLFYPTLILGLIGALHGFSNSREHLPLLLVIISISVAYGITTAAARFRIPMEPFLILYAAQGAVLVWSWVCSAQRHLEDYLVTSVAKASK